MEMDGSAFTSLKILVSLVRFQFRPNMPCNCRAFLFGWNESQWFGFRLRIEVKAACSRTGGFIQIPVPAKFSPVSLFADFLALKSIILKHGFQHN
jgi:hypothetical protein